MGRKDDVVHVKQGVLRVRRLLLEDVEPGAGYPALLKGLDERRLLMSAGSSTVGYTVPCDRG